MEGINIWNFYFIICSQRSRRIVKFENDIAPELDPVTTPEYEKQTADKAQFTAQVSKWTSLRLQDAIGIVMNAERSCKSTGVPGGLVCERTLFQISSAARGR